MIIGCESAGCSAAGVALEVDYFGQRIQCGECNQVLVDEDLNHPNYPQPPEPEPSLEELVDQRLRDLGII